MRKRLEALLERARTWPEAAQEELVHVADQIETELTGDYVATQEELSTIEAALAAIDRAANDRLEILHIRHTSRRGWHGP